MYTAPVEWSTTIHGRSNGLTPIPPREGLIPRSIMPCSSRSLKTLLFGPNVLPPSVDRDTRMAPWGTLRKGKLLVATPPPPTPPPYLHPPVPLPPTAPP